MGRQIAVTMHYQGAPWLMRESREREEDCQTLLSALGIKPGQVVCDMGCGNGFYTLQMASLVGEKGRVLAVDIQPEMLHLLEERAKETGITNIELIQGSPVDPKLPPQSVDLDPAGRRVSRVFESRADALGDAKSAQTQGANCPGRVPLEDPKVPIKLLHKMSKKQILKGVSGKRLQAGGAIRQAPLAAPDVLRARRLVLKVLTRAWLKSPACGFRPLPDDGILQPTSTFR